MINSDHKLMRAFLGPSLLIVILVNIIPFCYGLWISFSKYQLVSKITEHTFVGLENYCYEIFEDPVFMIALRNMFIWMIFVPSITFLISLILAMALNREFKGRNLIRVLIWLPWALPMISVAILWKLILQPNFGILNSILQIFGITGSRWLGDPATAFLSVMMVQVWRWVPFYTVTILAGLQSIPIELFEAASVDGANALQRFLTITLPMLADTIELTLMMGMIWAVKAFTLIYSMTQGGPANSTHILGTLSYQLAFRYGYLDRGAAVGVIMALILFVIGIFWIRREMGRWSR